MSPEPTPIDPDHPEALVTEPNDRELRSLRKIVEDSLNGHIYKDFHSHRAFRMKPAPGKFKSVNVPLTNCDRDHVVCDIPTGADPEHEKDPPLMRICLVCDAGREMLGLNGKPL